MFAAARSVTSRSTLPQSSKGSRGAGGGECENPARAAGEWKSPETKARGNSNVFDVPKIAREPGISPRENSEVESGRARGTRRGFSENFGPSEKGVDWPVAAPRRGQSVSPAQKRRDGSVHVTPKGVTKGKGSLG